MQFSTFLWRNLFRRRIRSLLTIAGITISIMAVVALLGVSDGYMQATKAQYALHNIDMVVVRAGIADPLNSSLGEQFAERLASLPDVESVNPVLTNRVSLGRDTPGGVMVQGLRPDSKVLKALDFIEGASFPIPAEPPPAPKPGEEAPLRGEILLGEQLAKNTQRKVGETLNVEEQPFKVIGVFRSNNPFENNTAIFLLGDLQKLMERDGRVSEFQLSVSDEARGDNKRMQALRRTIEKLRDEKNQILGLAAMPTQDYVSSNSQLVIAQSMAWVTSAIALFIGFVGMVNTMFTSVMERTQEIGVLRAIGWKKGRIMTMILGESLILSLVGALIGSALAFFLVRLLSRFEAAQAFVVGAVPFHVFITGLILATGVGVVGGLYPAIRATRLQPTEALRSE